MTCLIPEDEFNSVDYIKKIFLQEGLKAEDIITNNLGLDTVGEIYFTAETIIKPNKFKKFRVITSAFHMNRCLEIYHKILGPDYTIIPVPALSGMDTNPEIKEKVQKRELDSLKIFRETFKNVIPGDVASFEKKLYTEHRRYSSIPEKDKVRFHKKD